MTTPLHFNAFVMNTNSHIQHGHWRRPDAQQVDFENVDLWIDLARLLGVFVGDLLEKALGGRGAGTEVAHVSSTPQVPWSVGTR